MFSVASALGSMNILLVVLCAILSGTAISRIVTGKLTRDARTHFLGIALFAGGWSLQRLYWAINRSLEAMGEEYLLTAVYKSTSWITMIPMALVVVGCGLMMAPVMASVYGDSWMIQYLGMAFGFWLLIETML